MITTAITVHEPAIKDAVGVQPQPQIRGQIEFKNLNFAYNGERVLKDINLRIEQGKTVAFVGKTGSGKSTLVSLVPRLMNTDPEMVFVDGRPVEQYPLRQLRKSVGFVQQETFLFSNSLAENILWLV